MFRKLFSFLVFFFFLCPWGQVSADVVTGRAVDAKSRLPLADASVTVECIAGNMRYKMVSVTDSLGCFASPTNSEGRLTVTVQSIGYKDAKKRGYSTDSGTADTLKLGDIALEPTELMLADVVVSAKARRFTMSGDTIIFHPEAFKLEEGARLNELVRRLPGVTEREGRLYWNDKPLRIQMNGHDIFGGGGLLGELPVEAVDNIKTYNKASELAKHTGQDDGKEDQVLDFNIKPGFMDKWYGDLSALAQSPKNYQLSGMAHRLSDDDPVMVLGDVNNVNFWKRAGVNWWQMGNIDSFGKSQNASAGYQHGWKGGATDADEVNSVSVSGSFSHKDGWHDSYSTQQLFLPNGSSTWGLGKGSHYSHEVAPQVTTRLYAYTDSLNYIEAYATFGYALKRTDTESGRAVFDGAPSAYGDFPYAQALAAKPGDPIYGLLVSRQQAYTQSIGEGGSVDADFSWTHFLGKKGSLTMKANFGYGNGNDRMHSHRQLDYVRDGMSSPLYQYSRSPYHKATTGVGAAIDYRLNKQVLLKGEYGLTLSHATRRQQFYATADEQLLHAPSAQAMDMGNSYHRHLRGRRHTAQLGLTVDAGKWQFLPTMTMAWNHERMDYRRGGLDTVAHRNAFLPAPSMLVKWKIDKASRLDMSFNYATQQPELLSTLAYRDDTNPLWITEGNALLRNSHSYHSLLSYTHTWARQQFMLLLKAGYTHTIHPVAAVMYYNPATGVYRMHNENMPSGNDWMQSVSIDKSFGDYVHLSNTLETHFVTSYGYLTVGSERDARQLNQMRRFSLKANPELSYERGWLNMSLYGSVALQRHRYSMAADYNSCPIDYSFGTRVLAKFPHWEFTTNLRDLASSGYLLAEQNRHRLLWDASAKWIFWKKKGSLSLLFDDILNKNRMYVSNVSSSERSETWSQSMHHYVGLKFTYHFDAKGKGASAGSTVVDNF